jgi:hypothetical protein
MQGLTTIARAFTSFATAGLGNFVVATAEVLLSALLSLIAFLMPLVAAALALGVLIVVGTRLLLRGTAAPAV